MTGNFARDLCARDEHGLTAKERKCFMETTPLEQLQKLATDFEAAYRRADAAMLQIREVDAAIQKIGVVFRPPHWAELALRQSTIQRNTAEYPFVFYGIQERGAHEVARNVDYIRFTEYMLCCDRPESNRLTAAQRRVRLFASACVYSACVSAEDMRKITVSEAAVSTVEIENLPVTARIRIIDVLDTFITAYTEHVLKHRGELLEGLPCPS